MLSCLTEQPPLGRTAVRQMMGGKEVRRAAQFGSLKRALALCILAFETWNSSGRGLCRLPTDIASMPATQHAAPTQRWFAEQEMIPRVLAAVI
jgi:hypothetical protein